jgi:CarD family transcriptional regulator
MIGTTWDFKERVMTFKTGDAVVHPLRGAGIVISVEERQWHGHEHLYYRIKLLDHPGTKLMIPTSTAKKLGLRLAISQSNVNKVWGVLRAAPNVLPNDHKERYQLLEDKLHTGDAFKVAEVVRDMAWRLQRKGRLTTVGRRRYKEGIRFLAGEIAAVEGIEMVNAEAQVLARLAECTSYIE